MASNKMHYKITKEVRMICAYFRDNNGYDLLLVIAFLFKSPYQIDIFFVVEIKFKVRNFNIFICI